MRLLFVISIALLTALGSGCVKHIAEYEPKRRDYKSPVDFEKAGGALSRGSLFNPTYSSAFLFADQRAMRLGDIVTIHIKEEADARRDASTELSRDSSAGLDMKMFFSLLKKLDDDDLASGTLLDSVLDTKFKGEGKTSRSEHLVATVPGIVRQVLPNGNLFIEGHRVVLVNDEEHHFYISGVIRPIDIQGDNAVASSLIADAEIEFTGRGVITDKQGPGWLNRGLDYISPF